MTAAANVDANRLRNLGYFFDDSVRRVPDKVCIIDLHGGTERSTTYRKLDGRMNRVAATLTRLGVKSGQRVGMLVGNRTEFLEFFFGSMRVGAIPVPINTHLNAETLAYILDDADCAVALIDPGCNPNAVEIAGCAALRHRLLLDRTEDGFASYEDELAISSDPVASPPLDRDAQALQLYTSGSTGRPKGVITTHRGILWYIIHNQRHWPVSEDDRGLISLPLFHKSALRGTVKPMLYAGGSFVIMPRYEPKPYLNALAKYRCTFSRGVAAVFAMFLQHKDYLRTLDLGALRRMEIGSGIVPPGLLDAVEQAIPGVTASESYGSTEGGSPLRPPVDGRPVPRGSIGVPIPDIELKLLDVNGDSHPDTGELVFRSPYVCLGYHNQPQTSRDKLRDGWLHTGDIFFKDEDGFYFFRSRKDDMFSCGGENVYPKEVENLLFSHPDVANAVVVPLPHAAKGFVPAAMIVPRKGASVTADEIRKYCLDHGPAYAHPRFVALTAAFPLSGAGKPDRALIQAELESGYRNSGETMASAADVGSSASS